MVKHSFLMSTSFARERFGTPQMLAALLLAVFLAQCAWLIAHEHSGEGEISDSEFDRVQEGAAQWHGRAIAGTPVIANPSPDLIYMRGRGFDGHHSPLWYLVGSAPVAVLGISPNHRLWPWLTRGPYAMFGVLLGASLWYVSRRLYGNFGGYIALALYCFSPAVIRSSTLWFSSPEIGAAWGVFGAVFTAIAVAHTLYAPREVVLWNWKRILLLGISLALAIGSHFSLAIILPLLLAFMLYVAPDRKAAAVVILLVSCALALLLVFAAYFFHPRILGESFANARWLDVSLQAPRMLGAYLQVIREGLVSGPVLAFLVPAALITYAVWGRSRYFGNTAPLMVAVLFIILRIAAPHDPESVFSLVAAIFLFVFVAGIAADLLETKARELTGAVLVGLLSANAIWNVMVLTRIAR
jgi:hypothetical protein